MSGLNSNPFGNRPNGNQMEQQITNLLRQVKQSGNPQQAIQNLMQRNPGFAQFLQGVQNPQQFVMQNLGKSGIDINKIMRNI